MHRLKIKHRIVFHWFRKKTIPKVFIADFGAQNGHFEYDFWKKYSDFWGRNAATFTKIRTGFLIG